MDQFCIILILVIAPIGAWKSLEDRRDHMEYRRDPRELRRVHSKRHMLPDEPKKRSSTPKTIRDIRKKPSGHLTPLEDDDMENDEVVSVAIGPPPIRTKYEKARKKPPPKPHTPTTTITPSSINFVKDILMQLSKEFLSRDVNENFVFGQYLGNSMKNLTNELRLGMQHEILELIVKYQKLNQGEPKTEEKNHNMQQMMKNLDTKIEKKYLNSNDTEEPWPDFSNLAKIVG